MGRWVAMADCSSHGRAGREGEIRQAWQSFAAVAGSGGLSRRASGMTCRRASAAQKEMGEAEQSRR